MGLSSAMSSLRRSLPSPGRRGRQRLGAGEEEGQDGSGVGAEKVGDTWLATSWGCIGLSMRHREVGRGEEIFFLPRPCCADRAWSPCCFQQWIITSHPGHDPTGGCSGSRRSADPRSWGQG